MRKLASIQRISNLQPILNADKIELATVMGWQVVVKKGEFQIGDSCVFVEVDSVLPDGPEWAEFMRQKNFRVKTAKLRGCLSQGLAFKTEIIPFTHRTFILVEDDVTEILGIKKYEAPLPRDGAAMGQTQAKFPRYVPKIDEIRIQSAIEALDDLKGKPYYITEKCDGTSATFLLDENGELLCCSRNFVKSEDDTNIYWQIAKKYNLKDKLLKYPRLAIQGEICGPGIQKNKLGLKELKLFVFNLYDLGERKYLNFIEFVNLCGEIGLATVPIEEVEQDFSFSLPELLEMAKGKYKGTDNHREGIVIRAQHEGYSPALKGRLSFKCLNNDFLLKED